MCGCSTTTKIKVCPMLRSKRCMFYNHLKLFTLFINKVVTLCYFYNGTTYVRILVIILSNLVLHKTPDSYIQKIAQNLQLNVISNSITGFSNKKLQLFSFYINSLTKLKIILDCVPYTDI